MPERYEIIVTGEAGPMICAALSDFDLQPGPPGTARFVGPVSDQAGLQGALHRLHDLRAELLEVRRLPD